jgi:hypothetical protein
VLLTVGGLEHRHRAHIPDAFVVAAIEPLDDEDGAASDPHQL